MKSRTTFTQLALLFVLALGGSVACGANPSSSVHSSTEALGFGADPFPEHLRVVRAMDEYGKDTWRVRVAEVGIPDFVGRAVVSSNIRDMDVVLVDPDRGSSERSSPIAFLRARFFGQDVGVDDKYTWNNRYKDQQCYQLFEWTGTSNNRFAEAMIVPQEGAEIIRWWNEYKSFQDYQSIDAISPEDIDGTVRGEVAGPIVMSYVAGNADGPKKNWNNAGLAEFRDTESGRVFKKGVVIDLGAAWQDVGDESKPWDEQNNVLGMGPVLREDIDLRDVDTLWQIARASKRELAEASFRTDTPSESDIRVVRMQRERAREVLGHYGFAKDGDFTEDP